jgi:hypothetical protein
LVWRNINAEVAELADAHGSGPCTRKGVGVRVPSSAHLNTLFFNNLYFDPALPAWAENALQTRNLI